MQVLYALLCFSDKVWQSWVDSPEDFVSREFEMVEDCVDLRASASIFIMDLMRLRPSLYVCCVYMRARVCVALCCVTVACIR